MPSTGNLGVDVDAATWTNNPYGAGAGPHLPVGNYGGADYRSAMRFNPPAGWAAWTAITSATLTFYISDHSHVAPKNSSILLSRQNMDQLWTKGAGSQSCDSGFTSGNTTQATDLMSGSGDRITFSSGSTANAAKSFDVTNMVRYYRDNNASKIVFVFDNNGADQYTEIWADEKSGYNATLSIEYEVQSPPTAPTPTGPGNGVVSLSDTPTFSWVHNDPQGDAQSNAYVRIYDASGTTVLYGWYAGAAQSLVAQAALLRGTTYQWDVATADAATWGPYSAKQSFSIKANPVVTIDATRYMDFNGQPRLRVKWSCNQTQTQYRVTGPSGYNSGIISGGGQDHLLDTLAVSDNAAVSITVEVWTNEGLYNYSSRSFTPRFGLTTHRRDLLAVPINWISAVVSSVVPAGAQLILQYGSNTSAAGGPTAWLPDLGSVPKAQWVFWRAWFIPSATASPTLNSITILSDRTTGKTVEKWYRYPNSPFGAPWAVDESEYVYGTRSVRLDLAGTDQYIRSEPISVKPGRSYILTGLMKSKGDSGAQFYLADTSWSQLRAEDGALIESPKLRADTPWFSTTSQDVNRYSTPIWVATTDTVYVVLWGLGVAGAQAWFDALKLEESTVATPWSPAAIGATVIDAGGVQIDGSKGGILRYRGTDGLTRSVVEGGAQGLLFGGDTPLASPSSRVLKVGDDNSSGEWGLQVAGGAGGTEGGQLTLQGPGATTDWAIDNFSNQMRVHDLSTVRLNIQNASPQATVTGDALVSGQLQVNGELRHAVNVWHRSSDNRNRFHFAADSRSYYESMNGHEFRGSADQLLALLDEGGSMNVAGGLFEAGVRVIQPMGLRIQRGTVNVTFSASSLSGAAGFSYSGFSAAPIVVLTATGGPHYTASLTAVPGLTSATAHARRNDGSNQSTTFAVEWIAIGPQ